MKTVLTAIQVEDLIQSGKHPNSFTDDVILTPSAKDYLRSLESPLHKRAVEPEVPVLPDYEFTWSAGGDPKTTAEILDFFYSSGVHALKQRICDLGKRLWQRSYVDGSGGNISVRVGDNLVMCTPTQIPMGFMTPEDLSLVNLDGKQVAGKRPRTSECKTHLAIMKRQSKCKAICHAQPTYATAFAVAGVRPPVCMVPDADVFLGSIGMAPYDTPGSPEVVRLVGEAGVDHMCVLMLNHGVITWGSHVEEAHWRMENIDSLCRTVCVAAGLNKGRMLTMSDKQQRDLTEIRKSLGMHPPQ